MEGATTGAFETEMETLDDARANNLALGTLIIDFALGTCLAFATDFIIGMAGFAIATMFDVSNPNGKLRAMGGGTGWGQWESTTGTRRKWQGGCGRRCTESREVESDSRLRGNYIKVVISRHSTRCG